MASPQNVTSIPSVRVPVIDERTGLMSREWYRYFLNLYTLTGSGGSSTTIVNVASRVNELEINPEPQQHVLPFLLPELEGRASSEAALLQEQINSLTYSMQPYDLTALSATVQALQAQSQTQQSDYAELLKTVQGLALQPSQPEVQALAFGSFYDTTTQTAAAVNTAYAVTFNTTDIMRGVARGSPTSRIYVYSPGAYDMQFSIQLTKASASAHYIYIWFRKNGTDIPQSASKIIMQGSSSDTIAAWNFVSTAAAGDYFELMWAVEDTGIQLTPIAATAFAPASPSVIFTINQLNL